MNFRFTKSTPAAQLKRERDAVCKGTQLPCFSRLCSSQFPPCTGSPWKPSERPAHPFRDTGKFHDLRAIDYMIGIGGSLLLQPLSSVCWKARTDQMFQPSHPRAGSSGHPPPSLGAFPKVTSLTETGGGSKGLEMNHKRHQLHFHAPNNSEIPRAFGILGRLPDEGQMHVLSWKSLFHQRQRKKGGNKDQNSRFHSLFQENKVRKTCRAIPLLVLGHTPKL